MKYTVTTPRARALAVAEANTPGEAFGKFLASVPMADRREVTGTEATGWAECTAASKWLFMLEDENGARAYYRT